MSKNMGDTNKATSLTKYMLKYGLLQGVAFSAVVAGIGTFVPGVFTLDATIQSLLFQCLPHLAFQQTLVSLGHWWQSISLHGGRNDSRNCCRSLQNVTRQFRHCHLVDSRDHLFRCLIPQWTD
jgi:hypothetical protein